MRLLFVDDDDLLRSSLTRNLQSLGATVVPCADIASANEALSIERFDAMLVDVCLQAGTTDRSGLDLLRKSHVGDAPLAVMLAGCPTMAGAAFAAGAADCLLKGNLTATQILAAIRDALKRRSVPRRLPLDGHPALLGTSAAMQALRRDVARVAPRDLLVLITGEAGVGKEIVARTLHQASGRQGEYVAFNVCSTPTTLFESALFGHVRGAFTGAHEKRQGQFAHGEGGTVLLDEIGELALSAQASLLRVLEDLQFSPLGSVARIPLRARVICATNADLPALVSAKSFRGDLYSRLNVVGLHIPPLRERREDISVLAQQFAGDEGAVVTDDALAWLSARDYAGNARELRNLIRTACVFADDPAQLTRADFVTRERAGAPRPAPARTLTAMQTRHRAEILAEVRNAVEGARGNLTAAAKALGTERRVLGRLLRRSAGS